MMSMAILPVTEAVGNNETVAVKNVTVALACVEPAANEFPADFLTLEQKQNGGLIIHVIIMIYALGMLGIVCQYYFVPSLEVMADYFKVPTDVAGATFMAMGTSAPELFSSVFGTFISEGDIGVSTIVGSAVFNVIGVTGIIGVVVWNKDVPVDWYPITRDCAMYGLTVAVLAAIISNNLVTWYEALIMLVMFSLYVVFMYFNSKVSIWSHKKYERIKIRRALVRVSESKDSLNEKSPLMSSSQWTKENGTIKMEEGESPLSTSSDDSSSAGEALCRSHTENKIVVENLKRMETEDCMPLWHVPKGNWLVKILWALGWPVMLLTWITIPNCKKSSLRKYFALTFAVSVIWIAALSYLCVWMVTVIGSTFQIPDTVSGITLLAIGTSMPEAITSIIVARNGLGNMALCNLLGSNVFDILFCLGLPWLLKTALDGDFVINSSGITYTTFILLSSIVALYALFIFFKWKINKRIGILCIICYLVFITISCLYELNVFGEFNLPPCKA